MNNTYIQVRIDAKTKQKAQAILANIGMDISSAVKILCRQIVNTGAFPLDLRDANGLRKDKAQELALALHEAKASKKRHVSTKTLFADLNA